MGYGVYRNTSQNTVGHTGLLLLPAVAVLDVAAALVINNMVIIIIIIIEGLSLLQSIPLTTANKQTQSQKSGGAAALVIVY